MQKDRIERFLNRKNIATLKAKEMLGEEKLRELLEAGIVPVEWEVYLANSTLRMEALSKIREIVNDPMLIDPQAEELRALHRSSSANRKKRQELQLRQQRQKE